MWRQRQPDSLREVSRASIIAEISLRPGQETMENLENVVRALEEEARRVRDLFESEVLPQSRRAAAELLRTASKRLSELAKELDTIAGRDRPSPH